MVLLLRRIILQLQRAYKRNDKHQLLAAVKFIAHLVNQQVLADEEKAKAIAFDKINKTPKENKRRITIATMQKLTSTEKSYDLHEFGRLTLCNREGSSIVTIKIIKLAYEIVITRRHQWLKTLKAERTAVERAQELASAEANEQVAALAREKEANEKIVEWDGICVRSGIAN
ncbi:pre-mRNA-splicing factor CWC22 [Tanacetum coccineum]